MEPNQRLIDQVLDQIVTDVQANDLTAIEELLKYVPEWILESFLTEDQLSVV